MSCLLVYKEEGRSSDLEAGSTADQIIRRFSELFAVRPGGALQSRRSDALWENVGKDFVHSEQTAYRYLIPRNNGYLDVTSCALFCCDMQERFRPAIKYFDEITEAGARLLTAAATLNVPTVVTEQYPKGLGSTVKELGIGHASLVVPKTRFSMLEDAVSDFIGARPGVASIILFGVEAHVCVQQTAADLCRRGYQVFVVVDATSSRSNVDRHFAFKRMENLGVILTTTESILLQLIGDKDHPHFKQIQSLIKVPLPDCGLLPKSLI